MKCPNCGGKTGVVETIYNPDANEIYRRRRCSECKQIVRTVEFEIEPTKDVRKILAANRKKYSK